MSKKHLLFFAVTVFILSLTLAFTSFAYSTDLYGYVSGLEDGKEYTAAKYNIITDTWGMESTLDSTTQLGSGIWKITDFDGKSEELFIANSKSGQITFWDSEAMAAANCLAGKNDGFVPGNWTISRDGAFKSMSISSMKSETIPTVCVHLDKSKVLQTLEGNSGYINAMPIKGEGNLLQESTISYGFTSEQVVPASTVKSFTIVATVVRTGAFLYNDGYSVADAVGEFTYIVKVPGVA